MKRGQDVAPDQLQQLLVRPDLVALGHVFARSDRREGTQTLWAEPGVDPMADIRAAEAAGLEVAALVFAFEGEVQVVVNHDWKPVRWLMRYVEQLAREIWDARGLDGFLAQQADGQRLGASRN